jgi:hypothetical protein
MTDTKELIKRIMSRLTMKRQGCAFVDKVDGYEVFNYVDCYGNKWLANWNYLFSMRIRKESSND